MAAKAIKKAVQNTEPNLEVDTTPVSEQGAEDTTAEETAVAEDTTAEADEDKTTDDPTSKLEVDTLANTVNTKKKPEERVKVRARVDHTCTIAMERYEFKAGQVYKVPRNVKNILNRAGLLAPL